MKKSFKMLIIILIIIILLPLNSYTYAITSEEIKTIWNEAKGKFDIIARTYVLYK